MLSYPGQVTTPNNFPSNANTGVDHEEECWSCGGAATAAQRIDRFNPPTHKPRDMRKHAASADARRALGAGAQELATQVAREQHGMRHLKNVLRDPETVRHEEQAQAMQLGRGDQFVTRQQAEAARRVPHVPAVGMGAW